MRTDSSVTSALFSFQLKLHHSVYPFRFCLFLPPKKRYETEIETVYLRRSIRPSLKIEDNSHILYKETRESVILKSSGKGTSLWFSG